MRKYETAVSRARGLGSAKNGFHHWWHQRLTAVVLVPLMMWLGIGLALQAGADFESARAWVANPFNATLLVAAIIMLFYHGALGVQVVIEDYVHLEGLKWLGNLAVYFACFLVAVAGILAVIQIVLGG
ncbi:MULTISPECIES: succinate dehydrogenase, hydrophobic membrane anchor protein [unclassified Halorhodospira]|uniref:succinate dehydrogenase, hydrophobic membrane anchor protein n=1 Tax=unclassified Halorhodospira TaxID=2626748 RepID=UPI001EE97DC7|nr:MULTISPECIES: succinate dehydrogenase, hydrophobic membrane anchor protein [unclassified Halorhodospira]MCG5539772.1 succinate dehydrogenase, hydrophobic membrane anchor protein [Halorhodospira sp. M39old]MCG5544778.1 succinate dehydrogenase, hydrophobic membrane anchor protein [Halorhodospira sp. M38]